MPVVLGLCGYAGSGKDEAAKGLVARGWYRVAFADGVRSLAEKVNPEFSFGRDDGRRRLADYVAEYGWHDAKKCKAVREFLQNLGNGVREIIEEDAWVFAAEDKIYPTITAGVSVVITDVRFQNEVDAVFAVGEREVCDQAAIVRITRPGVGPVNNHISETAIDDITPDYEIINDSTPEELQRKLVEYAESLSGCSKVAE